MAHRLYLNKKNSNKKNPNVSVVTCVLDGEKVIEKTIKNVLKKYLANGAWFQASKKLFKVKGARRLKLIAYSLGWKAAQNA